MSGQQLTIVSDTSADMTSPSWSTTDRLLPRAALQVLAALARARLPALPSATACILCCCRFRVPPACRECPPPPPLALAGARDAVGDGAQPAGAVGCIAARQAAGERRCERDPRAAAVPRVGAYLDSRRRRMRQARMWRLPRARASRAGASARGAGSERSGGDAYGSAARVDAAPAGGPEVCARRADSGRVLDREVRVRLRARLKCLLMAGSVKIALSAPRASVASARQYRPRERE